MKKCECKICTMSHAIRDESDIEKLRELALFALEMYMIENLEYEMLKYNSKNEAA